MELRTCLAAIAATLASLAPFGARAAQPDHHGFVSGFTASSGRLLKGMPDFAATESFLTRMRQAFPEPQPNGKGFDWPAPTYLDVDSLAHAASRDEMSQSAVGNYGAFLAPGARHHKGDVITVASCSHPTIEGRASAKPYVRRWEYHWHSEGTPGWQPEKMEMERVDACPPAGRKTG